jgi:signal transduction histidine kinase
VNENEVHIDSEVRVGLIREQAERLGRMLRREQTIAAQHKAVLAAITDGVILADVEGEVVLANQAARRMLQLDAPDTSAGGADAFLGQPLTTLFAACSPESQAKLRQAVASVFGGPPGDNHTKEPAPRPAPPHEPASVLLSYKKRVIQATLTPMLDEERVFAGLVVVLRDVTTEQEVAKAKNDFVSLVSHELRTPMTSIKGYTDLMIKGAVGELNEQQRHFMTIVKSNVDRMADLVSDLLDVSRLEAGRVRLVLERLDLASVVYEVSEELTETLRQRELNLAFDLAPGLPRVRADRGRVIQVLLNLLSNAYRYTPAGGTITIAVHAGEDCVQVDVSDTGIGIPERDRESIFERFYRVDHPVVREQAGTGLGLPIAKTLIELHGGKLWLCSEINVGSTFSFTLPLYSDD